MSAVPAEVGHSQAGLGRQVAVVLLGTGKVGGAFLELLRTAAGSNLHLVGAANSRYQQTQPEALAERRLRQHLDAGGQLRNNRVLRTRLRGVSAPVRVVIDATASKELALTHPEWLADGCHVITANKALEGGALAGWQALRAALRDGLRYGDSATVGGGLPALVTLRRLCRCGDVPTRIEGVFSGSFSYLFNHYDGRRPFSALLREARSLGYTEPDPRTDLSGEDVARKLLILARSAGFALERADIEVENLVPPTLCGLVQAELWERLDELDAPMAARFATAAAHGCVLRYLARFDAGGRAEVGLVELPRAHPAANLSGADNLFAFTTPRYANRPLVIQGAGAGPEVTAQALLGDILALD